MTITVTVLDNDGREFWETGIEAIFNKSSLFSSFTIHSKTTMEGKVEFNLNRNDAKNAENVTFYVYNGADFDELGPYDLDGEDCDFTLTVYPNITCYVDVVNQKNAPIKNIEVTLDFPWSGMTSEYTDSDGRATFELDLKAKDATIWVDSEKFGPYKIEDGASFTININDGEIEDDE